MATRGLALLLMTFAFYNDAVLGNTDCTIPWLADKNPFIRAVESEVINRCPPLIGDQTKEYCCYNGDGVVCCDVREFLIFWFICLLPFLILLLIFIITIKCVSCLCRSCCTNGRRQNGSVVLAPPAPINFVYLESTSIPYQPVHSKFNP